MSWALILGSSSGSGAAIARALANNPGLDVLGVHRGNHKDAAAEVVRDVVAAGRRMEELVTEAAKLDAIEPLADEVAKLVPAGSLQVFVHSIANASVGFLVRVPEDGPHKGAARLHPKQIDKTFLSMAHSFVYWVRALYDRGLFAPDARILALTNAINDQNLGNLSAIAASKSALETYVRHLAWELGPLGMRVNALKFGTTETTALRWIFPDEIWEEVRQVHHTMHPAGRMVTTEEVGAFVSVLAGPAGAWFNGAVIDMTGGQMLAAYDVLMREVARAAGAKEARSSE